jgi:hypothetical protein
MSRVRVGMIGYNEGNGHPYSFSAIINGYNESAFPECPYPVINDYLKARGPADFGVHDFHVTHVWTPDPAISKSISNYANIGSVVEDYREMVGKVDAVIIARDDPESHREIATQFLPSGTKLFIDKPLCSKRGDLAFFSKYLESGQIMSCSGLRYYPLIQNRFNGTLQTEEILFCHCTAPVEWFRYGIHALEGVYPLFESRITSVQNIGEVGNEVVRVNFASGKYVIVQVVSGIGGGIRCTIFLEKKDPIYLHFNDNFSCFKAQLVQFWDFVVNGEKSIAPGETINIVEALIAGDESRSSRMSVELKN